MMAHSRTQVKVDRETLIQPCHDPIIYDVMGK